jgi:hypothetical protein
MAKAVNKRLPRNFHKTFIPERQYIHALLRYAAAGKSGDYQQISATTGIPTGESSGKVPAILDFCRGMGLVRLTDSERSATKCPELTPFGRAVLLEDAYLKESITQWIAHFNLCSPITGAEVWYQVFVNGIVNLGTSFTRQKLEEYISLALKIQNSKLIGPLIRMYEDDAAFRTCGVLTESANVVERKAAPIEDEYGLAYGAWLMQLMTDHFPKATQVTVTELDVQAGWRSIPGWNVAQGQRVLELIERKGIIVVDRLMEPWILRRTSDASSLWGKVYDDLI